MWSFLMNILLTYFFQLQEICHKGKYRYEKDITKVEKFSFAGRTNICFTYWDKNFPHISFYFRHAFLTPLLYIISSIVFLLSSILFLSHDLIYFYISTRLGFSLLWLISLSCSYSLSFPSLSFSVISSPLLSSPLLTMLHSS